MREGTSADFVEYVKVANGLKHIDYLSTAFIPKDIPQDIADGWRLYLVLAHSRRPVVSGAFTAWGVPRMGEFMERFRQDKAELVEKPMAMFTCCPNTPLRWGEDPSCNMIDCAEWGIPVEIVPVLLLGMISPTTPVGALVLHTAEILSGLTIMQRVRPGTPVVFGGAPASFHMQLLTNPMTAVEALQVYCGYAQVAKRLQVAVSGLHGALGLEVQRCAGGYGDRRRRVSRRAGAASTRSRARACWTTSTVSASKSWSSTTKSSLTRKRFVRPVSVKDDLPSRAAPRRAGA